MKKVLTRVCDKEEINSLETTVITLKQNEKCKSTIRKGT